MSSSSSSSDVEPSAPYKPNIVRLPNPKPVVLPQLQIESEQSEQGDFFLWQVYAFGGYIVLKWLWGKWKERQNHKGDAGE